MKFILVVDDEPAFLTAIELALASEGYDVRTADSGEEALAALKERKPDLILLDIMMPGLSGLETLKLLRSHAQYKKVPVVLVSAALPLGKQSDYGWSEFIRKPFELSELLSLVKKYLK